jgi:hypothetical protein
LEREKPWWQVTIQPDAVDFLKKGQGVLVPDQWRILFYPEDADAALFNLLHEGSRSTGMLPDVFADVDRSICIKNWRAGL